MKSIDIQSIERFDRLEALRHDGADPAGLEDRELAADLRAVYWLEHQAGFFRQFEPPSMRTHIMHRLRRRTRIWWSGLAAAAAAIAAIMWIQPQPEPQETLFIAQDMLDNAMAADDREAMLTYLRKTEKLFTSLREPTSECASDLLDVEPEKELAKDLLVQQKLFAPQMEQLEYLQVRGFFHHLELILVDLNSLDRCTNPTEIEMINSHIEENRILTKLRLIAQEIQVS